MLEKVKESKFCFIISHIGDRDSPERLDADKKLKHIFNPIFRELNYETKRSDEEATAGFISTQIIKRLIESNLVIADISFENANVFYELAVRHAVKKPVIIIKKPNQRPPFDITDLRAIDVDMKDPDVWQPAMKQLKEYIIESEKNSEKASESILSNFMASFNLQSHQDKESDTLRIVKDVQSQMNRLSHDIEDVKHSNVEPNWLSSSDTIRDRSKIRVGNSYYIVKCKRCNQFFHPKYNSPWNEEYTERCTHCGSQAKYGRNAYFES